MSTADEAWANALEYVMKTGDYVSPRGQRTREALGHILVVDMATPVVTSTSRRIGRKFMVAEAAWIMSGSDLVADVAPHNREISKFSDDGVTFFGAYGPRLARQWNHLVGSLDRDPSTRQSVATIWRPNPPVTRDTPCTLSLHLMIRDDRLDAFVDMRSSDVWLGVPYDIFSFSMYAAGVLLELRRLGHDLRLGRLVQYAHSRHVYERDFDRVLEMAPVAPGLRPYAPFDPAEFDGHADLETHLWALARGEPTPHHWLAELF